MDAGGQWLVSGMMNGWLLIKAFTSILKT